VSVSTPWCLWAPRSLSSDTSICSRRTTRSRRIRAVDDGVSWEGKKLVEGLEGTWSASWWHSVIDEAVRRVDRIKKWSALVKLWEVDAEKKIWTCLLIDIWFSALY